MNNPPNFEFLVWGILLAIWAAIVLRDLHNAGLTRKEARVQIINFGIFFIAWYILRIQFPGWVAWCATLGIGMLTETIARNRTKKLKAKKSSQ